MEGFPVALNGIEMPLVELIEAADTIAGDHGVGRSVIRNEDGAATMIDLPAAAALIAAHGAITRASESPLLQRLRRQVAGRYAAVLDAGEWISDARPALDAFIAEAQKRATGTVRLRLRRGRCRVEGGRPPDALTPGPAPQLEPSRSAADADPGAPLNLVVSH